MEYAHLSLINPCPSRNLVLRMATPMPPCPSWRIDFDFDVTDDSKK